MTWRLIETAATDTIDDVLVSDGDYVTLAWFNDTLGVWMDDTNDCYPQLDPQPTHWQPKPAPPAAGDRPQFGFTVKGFEAPLEWQPGDEVKVTHDGREFRGTVAADGSAVLS